MSAPATSFVGAPEELTRVVEPRFADDARADLAAYVLTTRQFNQRAGGRFNPPGAFAALYMASDGETAWAEWHARFLREGIPGLPQQMGMLRVLLPAGRFVDLSLADQRDAWGISADALLSTVLTVEHREACWRVAHDIRSSADFLRAPSARAAGERIPLFVRGRRDSELPFDLAAAYSARETPAPLRQAATTSWDE
jgi:RES domain-containing protein